MIKKKIILNLILGIFMVAGMDAQFLSENPEYVNMAQESYVDVYYEYAELDTDRQGLTPQDSKVARGFWNIAESVRKRLICESASYRVVSNIEKPAVNEMVIGSENVLSLDGMVIQVEDRQSRIYRSDLSPVKARQNTWRAGYYYYDAHLLEFQLASADGDTLPLEGEIVLHAYPDKIHIEARLNLVEGLDLEHASMVCHFKDKVKKSGPGWTVGSTEGILAVLGGELRKKSLSVRLAGENVPGGLLKGHLVFIPGEDEEQVLGSLIQEANPLPPGAFHVRNGLNLGYDPAAGFYLVKNNNGLSAGGFTSFYLNPNMYLSTGLDITNDGLFRKIYIKHFSRAGSIESAVLTDSTGFPLPVPIECAKNFGGEKEEPDETPFNESYFPIKLDPMERKVFNVLHLHQNWGDHALRQLSSIRFFQIYYHLSQGVTETTCFSLPTKFDSILSGETRAYTLADYRPLSGQTWHGSPQHHHVALQGWLQYQDAGGHWRYPVYKGGEIYSSGPNLAWFTMNYVSSDGKVDQQLEIFEMPQADESRTHIRLRYTFKEDVEVGGEVARNFRLLNSGSYIRKVHWKELAWTGRDGEVKKHPILSNGEWAITGEALKPYNAFFCAYPHYDGNNGIMIRKVSGRVNGEFFNDVGFSAISHEDGKTELMMVPLIQGNTIRKGSVIEIDCIQIPYGNEHSNWGTPYEESVRYGLNAEELEAYRDQAGLPEKEEPVFGLQMDVLRGQKVMDLPPFVRAEDNHAEVRITGGHERISLVASGFGHPKYPMLWEGDAYLDPQVKGHDGIQSFTSQDGTYGFVFTPRVRTTKVSGKWGSRPHTYHITQVLSDSDIKKISSLNGRVRIEQFKATRITLESPRIWCPARNETGEGNLIKTVSESQIIETVPITIAGDRKPGLIEVKSYRPDLLFMKTASSGNFELTVRGLFPESIYILDVNGKTEELRSDRHGRLMLALDVNQDHNVIKLHIDK